MSRRTTTLTSERRAEIVAQAAELAERAAAALASPSAGERVAATLGMSQRIAGYSIRNQVLLMEQAEERGIQLQDVDTFRGWLSRGRCVRKGERGLKIVRPVGEEEPSGRDDTEQTEPQQDTPTGRTRFRIMTVFEISQTDIVDAETAAADLAQAARPEDLWNRIARQISAAGYLFNWPSDAADGPADVDHDAHMVHVRPDLDPADPRAVAAVAGALAAILTRTHTERAGVA